MPKPLKLQGFSPDEIPELAEFTDAGEEIKQLAARLFEEHGLDALGWKLVFDNSKRRLGECRYKEKEIGISRYYLHNVEQTRDTLLHEIAHVLVGSGHGHDWVWQEKCREIGAKPERLADPSVRSSAKPAYVIRCVKCGAEFKRYRLRPALLKRYYCAQIVDGEPCKGRFTARKETDERRDLR